ncbi:histidine kinase famiy protein [Roseomonas sp. BN140053]|uniref:histidine kinase famiy protein n=1 Tax=Roseomonas sp. BN140053 TaxID=3391898 RepID=UPI0039EB0536
MAGQGEADRHNQSGRDIQGGGQSSGIPARGEHDGGSYSPLGAPGLRHWQEATISQPGLDDRGGIFFAAIEMTRMPMILTDPNLPDNPIVFANRAFQDLTGYETEDLAGRNCRFLQGSQTDRAKVAELRDAIAERRAVSVELLNYKRDGTPFWNGVYIAPVHDQSGKLIYFFASQLDVTRRRTSEQAFRQAQKMESIGQLTAGLAHDFNNLLQVVSGNLEVLRGKLADDRLLRYLGNAAAAAERGAKLTRQLLAFARKTRLEPRVVDLNALIHEFGEMLESTAGSQVALQVNLRRRLPAIQVDPVHLEMSLLNVLINARDAMTRGGNITVSTGTAVLEPGLLPGGRYVSLSVTDDGEGMPPHVLERATEPFFTTKPTGKGTGLGLAMAQGFVQQSLGRLEIESEPGRGTTVRMLFPAVDGAEAPNHASASQPAEGREGEPRGRAETILVVEDNDDVLAITREHLETLGYRVLTATGGSEALEVLESRGEQGIDLLFTDLVMPGGMNGLVLAEAVRQRLPGVPILLTTGYNEELVAEGPRTPAMDVLGKPYRRAELADRVRAALDGKPGRTPPDPRGFPAVQGPRHEG